MILVDSSVWVDHLRSGDTELVTLLNSLQVLIHPFVLGELACGNLKQRTEVLTLLKDMPSIKVATDDEVLYFIECHALMGKGIGYVDAHLLAAVVLADGVHLWTRGKRLRGVAESLALAYSKV